MGYTETPDSNTDTRRVPCMVRIPVHMLQRIDATASRLGLSRSAYMLQATIEKMEQGQAR